MVFRLRKVNNGLEIELRFPYDAGFIEVLKDTINSECRRWSPANRCWYIHGLCLFDLEDLCEEYGSISWDAPDDSTRNTYTGSSRSSSKGWDSSAKGAWGSQSKDRDPFQSDPPPDPKTRDLAALHLLPTAPLEVVRAVYRALSLLHHPDLGGDEARMKEVNNAYERLQKVVLPWSRAATGDKSP